MQAIIPNKLKILNDSVPENDAPAWDAATAYHPADPQSGRAADRVTDEHYVYEAMAENTGKQPSANSDYDGAPWRTLNVTNKYACLDLYRSTRTMAPEGVTDLVIQVPFKRPATGFGLLNMAASSVTARVKDGPDGAVIWDGGEKRLIRDTVSLWHYLFEEIRYSVDMVVTGIPPISGVLEITLHGGRPAVGSIVAGEHVSLGRTQFGPSFGLKDYSVNTTDAYGNVVWVKRRNARVGTFVSRIPPQELDYVQQRLADMSGDPALWIGDDGVGFQSMIIFGFLKQYDPVLIGPNRGEATFDIEGIV